MPIGCFRRVIFWKAHAAKRCVESGKEVTPLWAKMLVKVFGRKPEKGAGIFFIPILAGRPPGAVRLYRRHIFYQSALPGQQFCVNSCRTGNRFALSFGTTVG
jgi:hypothetical protein